MQMNTKLTCILALAVALLLVGCDPEEPTDTPTPTTISTPTRTNQPIPYVYRVVANTCTYDLSRHQTGFKVAGIPGLVTALHGVVDDCNEILAIPADNVSGQIYRNMRIAYADIKRDIAILVPSNGVMDMNYGFLPVDDLRFRRPCGQTETDPSLFIYGYPGSNALVVRTTFVAVDCIRPMKDRVPIKELRSELKARRIGVDEINIYDLEASVTHGQSGSPLLMKLSEQTGEIGLLGVVIGRLVELPSDAAKESEYIYPNGWAVVWSELEFEAYESARIDIQDLATMDIHRDYLLALSLAADERVERISALRMQPGKEWSSSLLIDNLFTTQDSCVAIYSSPIHNANSVRVAVTGFDAGVDASGDSVAVAWNFPASQTEIYRQFCATASQKNMLTLYAYLVRQEQGDCSENPIQQNGTAVSDTFVVSLPEGALDIGVCSLFR